MASGNKPFSPIIKNDTIIQASTPIVVSKTTTFSSGSTTIVKGLKGDKGEPGKDGIDATQPIPEDTTIIRDLDGNITSVVKASKTVIITRTDGQISSVSDGTYQKNIIRTDGIISSIDVITL